MVYTQDSFTDADDTLLLAHDPDIGTWDSEDANSGRIIGNKLTNITFGAEAALCGPAPDTADYSVSADLITSGGGTGGGAQLLARAVLDPAVTGYSAGWDSATDGWAINSFTSGVATVLAESATPALVDPGTQRIRFDVEGDALALYVDDVLACATVNSDFVATEKAGVHLFSLVDEWLQLDNFLVDNLGGISPGEHELTGRGMVAITSPAWLSVSIAGRPDRLSSGMAEPPNWYHVGMLSWGTENGVMTAHPITRDLELIQLPSGMTELHYQFASGVTATVIELASP